jgi:hypothetical protein
MLLFEQYLWMAAEVGSTSPGLFESRGDILTLEGGQMTCQAGRGLSRGAYDEWWIQLRSLVEGSDGQMA